MKILVIALMTVGFFTGCRDFGDKPKEKELVYNRLMIMSLENSINVSNQLVKSIMIKWESYIQDPKYSEKAKIWKPKMDTVIGECSQLVEYIVGLKSKIKELSNPTLKYNQYNDADMAASEKLLFENGEGIKLFMKLIDLREVILGVDASIKIQFEQTLPLSLPTYSNRDSLLKWLNIYFKDYSAIGTIAMLTKFECDILNSEAFVIGYLNNKACFMPAVYDDELKVFTGTNSQLLKPGQELIITAGVGEFSKAAQPTVIIDGVENKSNAKGFFEYKTKVGKPGKYSKEIVVRYYQPDGTQIITKRVVNYEVATCY